MAKRIKPVKRSRKQPAKNLTAIEKKNVSLESPSKITQTVIAFPLLILWLYFCWAALIFPRYVWLFPNHPDFLPFHPVWVVALVVLGGMVLLVRFSSKVFVLGENRFPPIWSKIGLFAALILAVVLCLYHMDMPFGAYADDCAYFVQVTRHLKDLADYSNAFIFERGLLPVWPYTALFFWHLLPADTGLMIQRLTGTFFDLGTVWALYLAGKEIAGQRAGLLAALLASISRPLLTTVVTGYASTSLPFGLALVIWTTIRLTRKSSIFDFLWWGASIGFAAYTTAPIEPFIPFFIFMGLGLIGWSHRSAIKIKKANFLIWISFLLFLIYFLSCNNGFPNNAWFILKIRTCGPWILAIMLALGLIFSRKTDPETGEGLWNKWFWGSWLATFLSFPSLTNDYLITRIEQHSMIPGAGFLSPTYLWSSFHRLPDTIQWLFWTCQDRADMSLSGDPLFSYSETVLIGLGLVFCLAKPDAKRIFLLLTAALGIMPHFFAGDNHHSGLLLGCVVPFLLISVLGLNDLLDMTFNGISKGWFSKILVSLFLIAFWAWSAQGLFSRVYTQWSEKKDGLGLPREAALRDVAKGYRVYLSPQFFSGSPEFYEGSKVYLWHDSNLLDLSADEKVPTVVVYCYGEEVPIRKTIAKIFAGAKLEALCSPYTPGIPAAFRCEIPADEITTNKKSILYFSRLSGPFWKRSYVAMNNLLNLSMIDWEDKSNDPQAVPLIPNLYSTNRSLEMETVIHIIHRGNHEIVCKAGNRTQVWIDGKKIYDLFFQRFSNSVPAAMDRKISINLSEGDHKIDIITCFQFSPYLPDISFRQAGSTGEGQSLWKNYSFD